MMLTASMASPLMAAPLVIGTISSSPQEEIETFQPFADYLASNLAANGIDAGDVVIAADIPQMAQMLLLGEIDLYIDSSIVAEAVNSLSGSQTFLRRWKKGRDQYRSVIFTLESSSVAELDDLQGKVVAFEEPFSTSGFILPAASILSDGYQLKSLDSSENTTSEFEIGFVMANDNDTQAAWIESGRVAAAAMSEGDFLEYSEASPEPFRAIQFTEFVPYHVVVHRPGLSNDLISSISSVLQSAHKSETGKSILKDFEKTTKFDEVPDDLMANVGEMQAFIGAVLMQ